MNALEQTNDEKTELVRLQQSLQAAEARFRAIINRSADGIIIVDQEGIIRFLNPAAEILFNRRSHEVVGAFFGFPFVPGEHREIDIVRNFSFCQKPSHKSIVVEMCVVDTEWEGNSASLVTLRDITERKRAEDTLRESEERYSSIFENHHTPMLLIEPESGKINHANPAACSFYGYTLQQLTSMKIIDLNTLPPEQVALEMLRAETMERKEFLFKHLLANGDIRDVEVFCGPIMIKGVRHLYSIVHDITDRKKAEEAIEMLNTDLANRAIELENANRELESFGYTVSHDLRRPLTNINGFCQVLTQVCGHELSEQCRGFVKEIYDATLTMDQLITALLNFSQVSRAHLNREQVNLSKIAGSIISELRFTAPERQVVWHIAENITAAGDSNLLRVVLENLLGNAWKYSARANPARIEFATTQSNGETIFFVRDNGVGFPIDRADKLFHSFQRLHKSEEFEGHGIGLATVHRIIERHGGKIWVEAELDKGATFFFTLPSS